MATVQKKNQKLSDPETFAVATITPAELTKVEKPILNANQLESILAKTPKQHRYTRPAKGGGTWEYVTGVYIKKKLNLIFGWDWSFEVKEHKFDINIGQAYVLGRLTVNVEGRSIVKEQFGRVDIKFRKQTAAEAQSGISRMPLDIGNDLKAATTDALKKCAAELGIASDVYAPTEFKEIFIKDDPETDSDKWNKIVELAAEEGLMITEDERIHVERVINDRETASYDKTIKLLISKLPKK